MLNKSPSRNTRQRKARKKRQPIACARCRRLKRRCDRANPCLSCKSAGKECTLYDVSQPESGTAGESGDGHPGPSWQETTHNESLLLAILRDEHFIDLLLRIWFSHVDFMYDSAADTPLHHLWTQQRMGKVTTSTNLQPLIFIILALTCQIAPDRIGSAIANCTTASSSANTLVTLSFEYAKRASDAYLEACSLPCDLDVALVDHLHASLLVAAYLKNADKLVEYRTRLSRDIAFLHCIHIHLLGDVPQAASRNSVKEMVRRLWWSYFQYDRFYWLMDQSYPYQMKRSHCDISFLDHTGMQQHISCGPAGADSDSALPMFKLGSSHSQQSRLAGETRLSEFSSKMICIALATEHVSDRLAELGRLVARLSTHREAGAQLESAIDNAIADFNSLFSILERQQWSSLNTTNRSLTQTRQDQVSSITLDTLRYKACTALANCASRPSIGIRNRLCVVTAQATATLVQKALGLTAGLSPSELRWAFFINYIGQSTADLARLVLEPSLQLAGSHSWVGLLVRSRNFLCLIANQNRDPLTTRVAQAVCLDTARIFTGVDKSLEADLRNIRSTAADAVRAEQLWQQSVRHLEQHQGSTAHKSSRATATDLIMPGEHELLQQIMFMDALEDLFAFPV